MQWRTICVTECIDQSAMLKVFVQEWVCVKLDGDTARGDISRPPSHRHRSRPRLQSRSRGPNLLGASLGHASCLTEDPTSGAFDLWDGMTLPGIFHAHSDPQGDDGPQVHTSPFSGKDGTGPCVPPCSLIDLPHHILACPESWVCHQNVCDHSHRLKLLGLCSRIVCFFFNHLVDC